MVKNYIKIAIRNLFKHKTFSFINILGLTGGLTCCLLIFIFVNDELSYDKFHSKSDRIYRIQYDIQNFHIGQIPPVFAEHFESFFPQIEKTSRWFTRGASIKINPQGGGVPKRFEEQRVFFTDSSSFDIFDFKFVEGSKANALQEPLTIILNHEIKQKYFGDDVALGRTVYVEGKPFKVSGVVKDFPNNSHLHFDMLMPYKDQLVIENESLRPILEAQMKGNWIYSHSSTYVLLKEGQDPKAVEAKFPDFVAEKIPDQMKMDQSFLLQPLTDIHLNGEVSGINDNAGNTTFIMVFVAVGILTLLIACINFINLSTARSLQRTKEIGMRKVMGAWKSSLIAQFLGESYVTTAFASILAFIATFFLIPVLNEMTGRELSSEVIYSAEVLISLGILFLFTSFLAGLYPAFFVTKISPIYSLKGLNSKDTQGGLSFRRGLMIVQFSISIFLISGTLIVFDQLDLLRNKPMGFQKEHMINMPLQSQSMNNAFGGVDDELKSRIDAFENELAGFSNVRNVTMSSGVLGRGVIQRNIVPEGFTAEDRLLAPILSVDFDYVETYGLTMIAGRNFSKDFSTDEAEAFIINEEAIKEYNWESPENALGKTINLEGKQGRVIGVVKDFNFMSLTEPLTTLVMHISVGQFSMFSIKINNENIPETLASIETVWNRHFPNETFSHTFLDEQINQLYVGQERLGKMVGNFSILAILISCLGSYGLIIFVAGQKMKEIGIRKVLGASITGLVMMLSRQFMILALVSIILAVPVSYWAANKWLEEFSYRIDISPLSFIIAGLSTVGLVLLTIGYKSFRTAVANPVKALRNE